MKDGNAKCLAIANGLLLLVSGLPLMIGLIFIMVFLAVMVGIVLVVGVPFGVVVVHRDGTVSPELEPWNVHRP